MFPRRVTGGELFEDIVAREYYSEADARYEHSFQNYFLALRSVPTLVYLFFVLLICDLSYPFFFPLPILAKLTSLLSTPFKFSFTSTTNNVDQSITFLFFIPVSLIPHCSIVSCFLPYMFVPVTFSIFLLLWPV